MVPTSSAFLNLGCYWAIVDSDGSPWYQPVLPFWIWGITGQLLTFQMNRHWLIYSSSYGTFSTILILQSPVIWCMEFPLPAPPPTQRERAEQARVEKEGPRSPAIAKTKKEGGPRGPADKSHPLVHWRTDTAYICQSTNALAPAQTSWIISEEVRRENVYLALMLWINFAGESYGQ